MYFSKIDSMYVNEVEKADTIRYGPSVVYYFTLNNSCDSIISIPIRTAIADEIPENKSFLVNSKDTIALLSGYPRMHYFLKVPPGRSLHFDLETDEFQMIDLLERHGYSIEFPSKPNKVGEVDFLKKIARRSFVLLEWRGRKVKIKGLHKLKVIYRNPKNDVTD